MAHELDESTGKAALAFTGSRSKIWHGLGSEMQEDQPIEDWIVQAGLDWEVKKSDVTYNASGEFVPFTDRQVLYRSDTLAPLSVVSNSFKIVQPKQVVEFFRDLVEKNNMKLSTAGSLFGGKRFWALAELGKDAEIGDGDKVEGFLLLTTALDGSLKTTGKFVAERVVCNNTLSVALGEKNKNVVSVSHRSEFDADKVKVELGLLDQGWYDFISNMRKLSKKKISDKQAESFYQDLIFDPKKEDATRAELRKVEKLMDLYKNGLGAEMTHGNAWGWLNGATEMFTHGTGRKESSSQFWDSNINGYQDDMKTKALQKALALV